MKLKFTKFRKGFVTNSSSSSYVCEICGATDSGWDISLGDIGMTECENGHVICLDHTLDDEIQLTAMQMVDKLMANQEWSMTKNKTIQSWIDYSFDVARDYENGLKIAELIFAHYHNQPINIPDEEEFMSDLMEIYQYVFTSDGSYISENQCPICQFVEYSQNDLKQYLSIKYGISDGEVFEEIKAYNKRRKKLYDEEYNTYVCKKFNLIPAEIVQGWKNEFVTYNKFKQFVNGK